MKKKRKGGKRTPVIFRMFKGKDMYPARDCIAIFPAICDDYTGDECVNYVHIGQHGSDNPNVIMQLTRPATKAEYKALARELRGRGYRYTIYHRLQRRWRNQRVEQARTARKQVQANPAGMPWTPEAREAAQQPA